LAVDPIRNGGGPQQRVAAVQTHALFEQHARMVYGLCRALLRDPDDADDATQATFISAYRSLLAGNRVREPAAWLATIARNECAGRARSRMREPLPLLDADLGHTHGLAHMLGPEAELERKTTIVELRQAIAELPPKQREAVVLRDLYGLNYTEVGAALGISVASVESLLFRARRTLRVSLKPLASGALTVPVAVREGVAQAVPAIGVTGGGAGTGVAGVGLIAKLAGGPAALKAAAGVAAAIAAGSIAVAGVDHESKAPRANAHVVAAPAPSPRGHVIQRVTVAAVEDRSGSDGSSRGSEGEHSSQAGERSGDEGSSGGEEHSTKGSEGESASSLRSGPGSAPTQHVVGTGTSQGPSTVAVTTKTEGEGASHGPGGDGSSSSGSSNSGPGSSPGDGSGSSGSSDDHSGSGESGEPESGVEETAASASSGGESATDGTSFDSGHGGGGGDSLVDSHGGDSGRDDASGADSHSGDGGETPPPPA
jgi:RNA polymerase sigma factor (sigma-70 family)